MLNPILEEFFGGFSDQSWEGRYDYKKSTKAWLFSLDEKEKYPIKNDPKSNIHAIYTNKSYGPTFGNGHDLCVSLNNLGSSNLGMAYQRPKESSKFQSALGGAFQFKLEEVEIYAVDYDTMQIDDVGELPSFLAFTKNAISLVGKFLSS